MFHPHILANTLKCLPACDVEAILPVDKADSPITIGPATDPIKYLQVNEYNKRDNEYKSRLGGKS